MKRYMMDEGRKNFTDIVSRAAYGGERIIIGRRNKDLAVIMSIEDAKVLEYLEDREDVAEARKAVRAGGDNIPWEEVKKQLKKRSK